MAHSLWEQNAAPVLRRRSVQGIAYDYPELKSWDDYLLNVNIADCDDAD